MGKAFESSRSLANRHPELLDEWDHPLNTRSPELVSDGSDYKAHWVCTQGHRWQAAVTSRTAGKTGCAQCAATRRRGARLPESASKSLAVRFPNLAREWDCERNTRSAADVTSGSGYAAHWRCAQGHTWVKPVVARTARGLGCPSCAQQAQPGVDDVATLFPHLLAEWAPDNDRDPGTLRAGARYIARWRCRVGHQWAVSVKHRALNDAGCPTCSRNGTSNIERALRDLLSGSPYVTVTPGGAPAQVPVPTQRTRHSSVDILGRLRFGDQLNLVVEYDGARWHRENVDRDLRKTSALLDAGYVVIRLRDRLRDRLAPLELWHPNLHQFDAPYTKDPAALADMIVQVEAYLELHLKLATA